MLADRQAPRLDAREVEEVADQAVHAVAGALDRLDLAARPPLLVRRQVGFQQERARREHDPQRIAQIVRHDRQQVLPRAQRVLRLGGEAFVLQLDAALARHVVKDRDHALDAAAIVADRHRVGARPPFQPALQHPVADQLVDALAAKRLRARQLVDRQRLARLVPELKALQGLVARRAHQIRARPESHHPGGGVVRVDDAPVAAVDDHAVRQHAEHLIQLVARPRDRLEGGRLRLGAAKHLADLASDLRHQREGPVVRRPGLHRVELDGADGARSIGDRKRRGRLQAGGHGQTQPRPRCHPGGREVLDPDRLSALVSAAGRIVLCPFGDHPDPRRFDDIGALERL